MSEEPKKQLIELLEEYLSLQQATNKYLNGILARYQNITSSYKILLDELKEVANE